MVTVVVHDLCHMYKFSLHLSRLFYIFNTLPTHCTERAKYSLNVKLQKKTPTTNVIIFNKIL